MNDKEYYILGLLIGDSSILNKGYGDFIFFSNVNEEISLIVKDYCEEQNYKHALYIRKPQEENWSDLHIIEIHSIDLIEKMKSLQLVDDTLNFHLINNPHLIRGFFETSATFFEFEDKKKKRHRIAFSGTKEILEELQIILNPLCIMTPIVRRKEREHLGIISKSYRFTINRRDSKKNLLRWIYPENCYGSDLYKEKVNYYYNKAIQNPLNMYLEYNNYRFATKAMCKHLDLKAEGIRGGIGGGQNKKPIYIKDINDNIISVCDGWENTYFYISKIYQEKTGLLPPQINFNKKRKIIKKQ